MFKPNVFLRGLLLLAGDVETNPGPIQGRWRDTHIDSSIGGGGGGGAVQCCTLSSIKYKYIDKVRQCCFLACTFTIIGSNTIRHTHFCY